MYSYEIKPSLQKVLTKLSKKDKTTYEKVLKKIEEIINAQSIEHYKNLRYDLKDLKRVHVGRFVLLFGFENSTNTITFIDFDHHDNVY